jgi:DNA-binding HxlR family transcriptional regulator
MTLPNNSLHPLGAHDNHNDTGMPMTTRSPHRTPPPDDCPLDLCLKFLASAWATRILWFLNCGPRHFGALRRDLRGISAKVLTQRLRKMEEQGLISRRKLPTKPAQVEYRLTILGREFEPVIKAMIRVARKVGRG